MACNRQTVIELAPELEGQSETRVALMLQLAMSMVNTSVWLEKADLATALLTAHLLTYLSPERAGRSGSVIGERVGQVSVQYAPPGSDESLRQTNYGSMFLELRGTVVGGPLVLGASCGLPPDCGLL